MEHWYKNCCAQNMVAIGFIENNYMALLPGFIGLLLLLLCLLLCRYALLRMYENVAPETKEVAGGDEAVQKAIKELGPMKTSEEKLLIIASALLFFWVTEKVLHPINTTTPPL